MCKDKNVVFTTKSCRICGDDFEILASQVSTVNCKRCRAEKWERLQASRAEEATNVEIAKGTPSHSLSHIDRCANGICSKAAQCKRNHLFKNFRDDNSNVFVYKEKTCTNFILTLY